MKLRIRDNSVRLRLQQGEVETLQRTGLVGSETVFPSGRTLGYRVQSSPASVTPEAVFSESVLEVRLPESSVLAWASSQQVSIAGEQLLPDGECLKILVEKDFACLAPRDEDESDMFPHPNADKGTC